MGEKEREDEEEDKQERETIHVYQYLCIFLVSMATNGKLTNIEVKVTIFMSLTSSIYPNKNWDGLASIHPSNQTKKVARPSPAIKQQQGRPRPRKRD
ncbi:hypothetical protein EJB05_48962 [Eragrostis curvula]|uniref:Uncharacterized protein n=1 Tax=Eragrostis curvula TaxID=38414 RepID=A0A5J9T325_9POAL|nr:hypothetical protein EJB05_48962 [Eragrostis curvula]